ncbi:MAG: histidinol-phosphate transaminase [Polyangiaceae bacterium]
MAQLVTPEIESIQPYQAGTPIEQVARPAGAPDVIKLASNENPLGASPRALTAAQHVLAGVDRYPDSAALRLRAALAERLSVTLDEVIVGNGSNELLELVVRTFCTPEHHIVFAEPSFVVYRLAALAQSIPYSAVPLKSWTHDLPAMARAITSKTRVVFIANPNNPTGTYVGRAALETFLRAVPRDVIVVLDEAYIEYADAPDFPDGVALRQLHPRLVVTRTFSKIYGLAGLRIGYAVLSPELAGYTHRVRAPFNVGNVAQAAAIAALGDTEHVSRSQALNRSEKPFLAAGLTRLGLEVVPSQANFVFVDIKRPAQPVYDAMLGHGVIVRPIPPGGSGLRITVGTRAENVRCLQALEAVLA